MKSCFWNRSFCNILAYIKLNFFYIWIHNCLFKAIEIAILSGKNFEEDFEFRICSCKIICKVVHHDLVKLFANIKISCRIAIFRAILWNVSNMSPKLVDFLQSHLRSKLSIKSHCMPNILVQIIVSLTLKIHRGLHGLLTFWINFITLTSFAIWSNASDSAAKWWELSRWRDPIRSKSIFIF